MSFINPIPPAELGTKYTHLGWFCGLVPVYAGDVASDCPVLAERNWCPEVWFWIVLALFSAFCAIAEALSPDFDASFPVAYTGRIDGGPLTGSDGSML